MAVEHIKTINEGNLVLVSLEEGLMLKLSAFQLFMVAGFRIQLS